MTIRTARFCPDCGTPLDPQQFEGRQRRYCPDCGQLIFQQPIPAAGIAVVDEGSVLLIRRTGPPHAGSWAIPGGVMEHDERAEETAVRELEEETNIVASSSDLVLFDTWQQELQMKTCTPLRSAMPFHWPRRPASRKQDRTRKRYSSGNSKET
ncbi:NUDIX domain-containing protein [Halococcus dombrowskii]|uniref:NUDIX domain-containing protein n=1 Tax=Halococcus dombrowskii TaxID=179637 RepID=UPI003CC802EA